MAEIKDGGPAFPDGTTNEWGYAESKGLSKRDYFAAKAMQAYISRDMLNDCFSKQEIEWEWQNTAVFAYQIADAMLKAREVQNG